MPTASLNGNGKHPVNRVEPHLNGRPKKVVKPRLRAGVDIRPIPDWVKDSTPIRPSLLGQARDGFEGYAAPADIEKWFARWNPKDRIDLDSPEMKDLVNSLRKYGQLRPVILGWDHTAPVGKSKEPPVVVVDAHRLTVAARIVGLTELRVWYRPFLPAGAFADMQNTNLKHKAKDYGETYLVNPDEVPYKQRERLRKVEFAVGRAMLERAVRAKLSAYGMFSHATAAANKVRSLTPLTNERAARLVSELFENQILWDSQTAVKEWFLHDKSKKRAEQLLAAVGTGRGIPRG